MSRGPGRVQKIITDLIASNPHGAWSAIELCKHIYPRMERKHRIAVTRALRKNGAAVNVGCILEYLDAHAPAFFQSTPSIERSWTAFRKAIPWLLLPWPHSPRTISGTTKYSSSRSNGDLASPFRLHSEQSESGAADTGKSTTPASRFAVARRRGRLY